MMYLTIGKPKKLKIMQENILYFLIKIVVSSYAKKMTMTNTF